MSVSSRCGRAIACTNGSASYTRLWWRCILFNGIFKNYIYFFKINLNQLTTLTLNNCLCWVAITCHNLAEAVILFKKNTNENRVAKKNRKEINLNSCRYYQQHVHHRRPAIAQRHYLHSMTVRSIVVVAKVCRCAAQSAYLAFQNFVKHSE